MKKILFVLIVATFSWSCEDAFFDRCFSGDANVVRKEIRIDSAITRLYVMNEAQIYLHYNDEQKIELEFPENLMDDVGFKFENGNLYITSAIGVQVFTPEGKLLGVIEFPEQPANVTFGGADRKTLYVTARTGLYSAPMEAQGHFFRGKAR